MICGHVLSATPVQFHSPNIVNHYICHLKHFYWIYFFSTFNQFTISCSDLQVYFFGKFPWHAMLPTVFSTLHHTANHKSPTIWTCLGVNYRGMPRTLYLVSEGNTVDNHQNPITTPIRHRLYIIHSLSTDPTVLAYCGFIYINVPV